MAKKVSDWLIGCPKFKELSIEERANTVLKNKVCASCLSWYHEGSVCMRPLKCKEQGCTSNHNTLLHGSKNPKVMTITIWNTVVQSFDHLYSNIKQGMLETIHFVFEKWNIGTVILFDSGSMTLLITASLAGSLFLKGTE